jgi:hypothetical protein
MSIPKPTGEPPKPPNKRRNTTKPASYGLAQPVKAGRAARQPVLGFEAHSMVTRMWEALGKSAEAKFFSAADWQRARWELWYANGLFTKERTLSPPAWQAVQHALNELLVSPADKRRAGIELEPLTEDPVQKAAVLQIAEYQDALKSR